MTITAWWNQQFNKPPKMSMSVNNAEIAKRMVQNGFGYSIFTDLVSEKENLLLHKLILKNKDCSPVSWPTSLLYRKENLRLSAVNAFINFILDEYNVNCGEKCE
jgi:DNA-binding transcriptional LysR family regulator